MNETDLGCVLNVLPACPYHHYKVGQENSTNEAHHHWIVDKGGKKLSSLTHIHHIGHDKEGAPKECEMGAQALCNQGRSQGANLSRQR